ncbi:MULTISPECIES: carbohydrate ABC transporter permease [Sellimonas]|uniref:Carbohydrate ABC transporter permease n=1 Tax=Sellimonas caecigallum TaxID=2592333 RepID=A0ABS7L4V3_9FIRM|nr:MULTISPECIES: carbohydrate ABC transporter permease [Sellimonas]MBY0757927.1 carbohydrate ABC transporter permease [Sellimonas caecigallum]OUP01162.1 sugar ABC transporter permease [Drancourtella sp. An210]OUP64397.1 sugar ABC transporter permease [Drancourtella sp. An177]
MKKRIPKVICDVLLLVTALFCVLPFVYMILMSLKSTLNAYDFSFSLSDVTFQHYVKIFTTGHFFRYFMNSVIVALGGVALALLCSSLAGYSFAKLKFKGNDKIFLFLMMTMIVPSEVIIVPLYLIIRGFGWINTFKALILPLPTAFGVFIMRQAILGVPKELIESAKIDGAGDVKILWKVILPLVKSSMLTLAIFTFVGAWNNFLWPLVSTTQSEMRTLPIAVSSMKTAYDTDMGLVMAGAAVTFLPPFIFYLILQSKFQEGITMSGMKG